MIGVLRNPTYRALFSAQVIALLGTGLLTVALGLLAFELAGDAAGSVLGTALTIKMVAYVGVAPLVAAIVDRLPKKVVLVGADVVRLAIALLLPFVSEAWQIYVLVFVLQSASATFTPAFQSLIPTVLPEAKDYTRALALSRAAYDLEALLSPAIAALLLTVVSYDNLFVGTAIGFAASAVLVLFAAIPAHLGDGAASTFWERLPTGAKVFARTPGLRFLLATNVVVAAGTALVLVNSVVYAKSVFGLGDAALAITLGAYGVGSLLVAVNIPWIVDRIGVTRTMLTGVVIVLVGLAAAIAVTVLAVAAATGWWALLATWVLLGAGTSLINTPSSRLLADASTPANRNLVYTAQFAFSHACFLVTYPLAGWIGAASMPAAVIALFVIAVAGADTARAVRAHAIRGDHYWESPGRAPQEPPTPSAEHERPGPGTRAR
ncbi:MFS transporter [Microbacterium sp. CFBP9034]|uniref:MFS transporter n=1 Tax=Microbacterium sp. CFBP9034 TaxID=3096540 RepID=UPI002A6A7849|nr:MFS transporter [Microbacterium sp. CFBP9034]MDY0910462.1 MFS transporter [Microbacterium sp. CFBP9034]